MVKIMPLKYKLYVNFSDSEEESVKDEGSQQDEVKSEIKEIIDEPSLNSEKEDAVDSNILTAQLNKVTPISRNTNMDSTTKDDNVKGKKRLRIGFEGELSASPKMRVNMKLNRSQCTEMKEQIAKSSPTKENSRGHKNITYISLNKEKEVYPKEVCKEKYTLGVPKIEPKSPICQKAGAEKIGLDKKDLSCDEIEQTATQTAKNITSTEPTNTLISQNKENIAKDVSCKERDSPKTPKTNPTVRLKRLLFDKPSEKPTVPEKKKRSCTEDTPREKITVLRNTLISPAPSSTKTNNLPPEEEDLSTPSTSAHLSPPSRSTIKAKKSGDYIRLKKMFDYVKSQPHLQLFSDSEFTELEDILNLKPAYVSFICHMFLHCKVFCNVFKYCKEMKMDMTEKEVTAMYKNLVAKKIFVADYKTTEKTSFLLRQLTTAELTNMCKSLNITQTKINERRSRALMLQNLNEFYCNQNLIQCSETEDNEAIIREKIYRILGECCVKLNRKVAGLLRKLHYLYSFANIEIKSAPEVHQFLAQIMKKECVLPEYFVQAKEPFHTSTEFTKFVEASELKRSLLKEIRSKSSCRYPRSKQICEVIYKRFTRLLQENAFVPVLPHLQQFTAGAQYVEGLTSGAGYLHQHFPADVRKWLETLLEQKIYCQHLRPKWTLILMDLDCPWDKVAGFLISELDSEANSEIQKTKLSQVAELFRKNRKSEKNRLLIDQIMISMVSVPNSKFFPTVTVEGTKGSKLEIAGAYYRKFKYTHWMSFGNKVLPTLFSLLFWDIIYHGDVNAAFISDIQYIPLDMYCNFYKNRKVHIEKRLEEINSLWENEELNNFIRKVWKRHSHEKCLICPDIFRNDINNIILLIKIFGRKKISKVLRRYIMNCPETEVCFQTYLPIVKREIGINLY